MMEFEAFVEKANKIHNKKYDYINENFNKKVTIICKKHGKFIQGVYDHLAGHGCPICGKEEYRRKNSEKARNNFVKKAMLVHGDKYDYSKVNYINGRIPIHISCKIHGEFWQAPGNHLHGSGCPKCAKNQKLKLYEFIERAQKIHSDKYDYSKVNYINVETKICIICPEHGEFWQTPYSHLSGCGCQKCSEENFKQKLNELTIKNKDSFVLKAKKIHGNKYDYSKVEYKNNKTKVCIICPEHGEFWQTPSSHLRGSKCPKCSIIKIQKSLSNNTIEFIERAQKIHGNKYDYSKVEYKGAHVKVCIICPEHSEFWQTPNQHLKGHGCTKCGLESNKLKQRKECFQFIEDAIKIHKNDYDYSNVKYVNSTTKVEIKCRKCGTVFKQLPSKHLYGRGCLYCCSSHAEREIRSYLESKSLKYESEKTFPDLLSKNGHYLRFDFYLPELNTCIEFDGDQHFSHTTWMMTEKEFFKLQEHDKMKDEYCKKHGIRLIRLRKDDNNCYEIWKDIK